MTAEAARAIPRLETITIAIAPEDIALFKAIVESYDNLATLRTEDPRRHYLRLYFSLETEPEVRALLDSMRERFGIQELST
jgi:glycerol-3-phosphate dehydrogenase